ncbi:hypothetical protein LTS08_008888 [Lithohypha guttulata]|uniref:DUF4396 domain-containing protein n=1 Tax=Lithohypha guttulata TaxID=1690604 RepID=A0ABR0JTE1_9EURO|nr:hypothetical protein LTR24_010634 [Lithohypha guttulata]KAK5093551.1 hypothetical protein LTS08_008888 [Lithohypha guttulata]
MFIMIPVYIVNALYLWPITLWTYLMYGRPPKPKEGESARPQRAHHPPHAGAGGEEAGEPHNTTGGDTGRDESSSTLNTSDANAERGKPGEEDKHGHGGGDHMPDSSAREGGRPMFATITIGVCHCGAGCVLGDIVGEWLVCGTNALIGSPGRLLWAEFLVDFAFAFAFGIIFQYFSIAPMTGKHGPQIIVRALKADALSLLFFEIGLFGWMAAFQVGIFDWRLEMNTVTYWWMMQLGMFIGHWTGVPINWWLIKNRIKEPCA